nr:steroid 3-ketoacyl-CoA thiolase [Acidimicrobiales bacterium]
MRDVVIVEAVRTPVGRRGGGLSTSHSVDVLGTVQKALFDRTGVDPGEVGQVVGGCVGQVGMQTMNVTRTAWLTAGLPIEVPATTVDAQCGSSQQATNLAYALVASGTVDASVGCGVELMSRVGFGATIPKEPDSGAPVNRNYFAHFEMTSQFEGSERIADHWEITREECDTFGKLSQDR